MFNCPICGEVIPENAEDLGSGVACPGCGNELALIPNSPILDDEPFLDDVKPRAVNLSLLLGVLSWALFVIGVLIYNSRIHAEIVVSGTSRAIALLTVVISFLLALGSLILGFSTVGDSERDDRIKAVLGICLSISYIIFALISITVTVAH